MTVVWMLSPMKRDDSRAPGRSGALRYIALDDIPWRDPDQCHMVDYSPLWALARVDASDAQIAAANNIQGVFSFPASRLDNPVSLTPAQASRASQITGIPAASLMAAQTLQQLLDLVLTARRTTGYDGTNFVDAGPAAYLRAAQVEAHATQ